MYDLKKTGHQLEITIGASYKLVDMVCTDIKALLDEVELKNMSFGIILGVREALTNAIRHGSKKDRTKKIEFLFKILEDKIFIRVTDSGPGFDWRQEIKTSNNDTHGRGIFILKKYFDVCRFNKKGNQIELEKQKESGNE